MVTKYRKLHSIVAALMRPVVMGCMAVLGCLTVLSCLIVLSCGITASAHGVPEQKMHGWQETRGWQEQKAPEEPEQTRGGRPVQGPDIPPAGVRYDEWKGFEYSTDTSFPVRTYWSFFLANEKRLPDQGLVRDPENIEDAVLRITDAKAEPVGGEMKLRSAGYVDITIELEWTGTMKGYVDYDLLDSRYYDWGIRWEENSAYPFDAYTGTSLLNYRDADEEKADEDLSPGQAVISSMVESIITWNERTYRLFAKSDIRNASTSDITSSYEDDRFIFSYPGRVESTLTFRVPADYDGLVLAIDKDITDEKDDNLDAAGNSLPVTDLYADILTTNKGVKQTAGDFYFVRVSDLLKKFEAER